MSTSKGKLEELTDMVKERKLKFFGLRTKWKGKGKKVLKGGRKAF